MNKNVISRFMNHVDFSRECWFWVGYKDYGGYGRFYFRKKTRSAHRISYEIFRSKIPPKLHLDHICNNRNCVNPAHLETVTQKENNQRTVARNPKATHCKRGHLFNKENTGFQYGGRRLCKICFNNYQKNYDKNRRKKYVRI